MVKMKLKLEFKMKKRLGNKVITKDNMKTGIITGFHVRTIDEGTPEARYTVDYLVKFEDAERVVNENLVVILK
jgi:hypothetical protein